MTFLASLGWAWGATAAAMLLGAAALHLVPRLGDAGRRLADWWCAGFPLDVLVTYFTVLPLFVGPVVFGWAGLIGAVLGQLTALVAWTLLHELRHWRTHGRAKILRAANRIAGTGNNLFAVFWTAWCVPLFWATRVAEYLVYAPLTWTVKLPRYDGRQWVNVSRHKFDGLVGHDRIWCLYCDWMTGVWSLGSEMLRNVESFWCPIRFSSTAKCANCAVDFPDVANGWVDAGGTMDDVAGALNEHYGENGHVLPRSWWGHPSRRAGRSAGGGPVRKRTAAIATTPGPVTITAPGPAPLRPSPRGSAPPQAPVPLRFRGGPVTMKVGRDGKIVGRADVDAVAPQAAPSRGGLNSSAPGRGGESAGR